MTSEAIPARPWRPLRLMIVATLLLITLQVALGEVVGAGNYPTTGSSINSLSQLISAMYSAAGVMIFVHVGVGLTILLAAIGTTILARRYHKASETRSSGLGVLCVIIALLGGYVFAVSDFQNGLGILLMVNAALAAYAMYFLALYYTK
jgi:hypothetical protein